MILLVVRHQVTRSLGFFVNTVFFRKTDFFPSIYEYNHHKKQNNTKMKQRSTILAFVILLLLIIKSAVPTFGVDTVSLTGDCLPSKRKESIKAELEQFDDKIGTPLQECERKLSECREVIRQGSISLLESLQQLRKDVIEAKETNASLRTQLLATIFKWGDALKQIRDMRNEIFDLKSSMQRLETENHFLHQQVEMLENSVAEDS